MPQDFYVKLPFYVTEGTVARYVSVSFDGETVIPKTEIVSRDMRNPDVLAFQVSKEPGVYVMEVGIPDHSFEEIGAIVLKHFYVSPNNIDWYDISLSGENTDRSSIMGISLEEATAPHTSSFCGFWFGNSVDFNLEVPNDWAVRYRYKTMEDILQELDAELADSTITEENRLRLLENRDKIYALMIAKNS